MKTKRLRAGGCGLLFSFLLVLCPQALAQTAAQNFKPGAYRGTIQVITSIPDVAPTSTTLRVTGRSAGNSTLQMLAPPQLAQPMLGSGDDHPVKLYSLTYINAGDVMGFSEVSGSDFGGGSTVAGLQSLQIAGNVVRAETSREYVLNNLTVTLTIKVRLVRVGK